MLLWPGLRPGAHWECSQCSQTSHVDLAERGRGRQQEGGETTEREEREVGLQKVHGLGLRSL